MAWDDSDYNDTNARIILGMEKDDFTHFTHEQDELFSSKRLILTDGGKKKGGYCKKIVGMIICETDDRSGDSVVGVAVRTIIRKEKEFKKIMKEIGEEVKRVKVFVAFD